jgi:ATP/maltotriose-dependent transcriptional regulator MalT
MPLVALIDAELALRAGNFRRAIALGARAAEALGTDHGLTSYACHTAGLAALLASDYKAAHVHLKQAKTTARDEEDVREALYGLLLTSVTSESQPDEDSLATLHARKDQSPSDLLRSTTALILARRHTTGFAEPIEVESSLHHLTSVQDPRVRTAFTFTYASECLLRGDYSTARSMAAATLLDAQDCHLPWTLPHTKWLLAACALGLREFTQADRLLLTVERGAAAQYGGHLIANAAVLRARLLLAQQRPSEAYDALAIDDTLASNPAMKAEVVAMRALALGVLGRRDAASRNAATALEMSRAVEVRALAACAAAAANPNSEAAADALRCAIALEVWDPLICAIRAMPDLLRTFATMSDARLQLASHLRRSNDYDLARSVGIDIGSRSPAARKLLSPREKEVLQLVQQGLTNAQIAKILFISEATVKLHVHHILDKLGARTRTEAARFAVD